MEFHEKLELLMHIYRLSNVKLARGTGVDPSLVSRWRSGDRVPSARSSTAADIGAFLAGTKLLPLDAALLRQTLALGDAENAALAGAITAWLRAENIVSIQSPSPAPAAPETAAFTGAAGIVGTMARLLRHEVPEQPGPVNLWPFVQRGTPAEHEIFIGENGKRKAVLSFLHKLQSSPRALDVFILTGRNGDWMRSDASFPALWQSALLALLQKGHKLHIVLPEPELTDALKSWLSMPLFFTARCRVYSLPHRMADTLMVAQGHAAALSYGVGPKDEITLLFSGIMDSSHFEAVFHNWLREGAPVLSTVEDVNMLHERMYHLEQLPKAYYLAHNTLSAVFLPDSDMAELLAEIPLTDRQTKLVRQSKRKDTLEALLKQSTWAEVVPLGRLQAELVIDGTELGLPRDMRLTPKMRQRMLENIIALMAKYENLHILFLDAEALPVQIFYKQGAGAYFTPPQKQELEPGRPAAAFAGMPEGLADLEQWFTAHRYDRDETLKTLRTLAEA